jgi:hypothetical protein
MKNKINVSQENSKVLGGRLFITGLKMSRLGEKLGQSIVMGNTMSHPEMGLLYEYSGPYTRS